MNLLKSFVRLNLKITNPIVISHMKRSLITVTFLIFVLAVNSCGSHSDVFGGAKWIGPSGSDLSFYPDYMPVFKIEFDINIKSGKSGAILYGLNDPRLLNANLNKFNLENQRDSSFIKVEFGGDGKVSVYRKGYCPTDREDKPLATFDTEILSGSNHIVLDNNLGHFNLYVNGEKAGYDRDEGNIRKNMIIGDVVECRQTIYEQMESGSSLL